MDFQGVFWTTSLKLHRENQALCSPILAVQLHTQNLTLLEPEIFLKDLGSPKLSSRAKTLDVVLPSLVSMGPLAWPQLRGYSLWKKSSKKRFSSRLLSGIRSLQVKEACFVEEQAANWPCVRKPVFERNGLASTAGEPQICSGDWNTRVRVEVLPCPLRTLQRHS